MKTSYLRCLLLGAALLAGSLDAAARPLRIVATVPDLAAVAAAIAGDLAQVRTVTTGKDDPHFLQAKPAFVVLARDADLWLRLGLEMEVGWEPVLIDMSRNPRIRPGQDGHFDAGAHLPYVLGVPEERVTRAQGDVHSSGSPHFNLDPLIMRHVAAALAGRLQHLDPAHADRYAAGLAAFTRDLDEAMFGRALVERLGGNTLWNLQAEGRLEATLQAQGLDRALGGWYAAMAPLRGKPVVTFHKSWGYFAKRFGLEIPIELEPLPGVPPGPAHLARVAEAIRQRQVGVLLMEPFYPRKPADVVTRGTDARVVVASAYATSTAADGYRRMLDGIVTQLAQTDR